VRWAFGPRYAAMWVIGAIALPAGIIMQSATSSENHLCQSGLGELAQSLDQQASSHCIEIRIAKTLGFWVVMWGIAFLLVAAFIGAIKLYARTAAQSAGGGGREPMSKTRSASNTLEVTIDLNRGVRPDKNRAGGLFQSAVTGGLGLGYDSGRIRSSGTMYWLTAEGVTGLDYATMVTVSFRPGKSPAQPGRVRIQLFQDPGGFVAAVEKAARLMERLAQAYDLKVTESPPVRPVRRAACVADFMVTGWGGVFRELLAVYTPGAAPQTEGGES